MAENNGNDNDHKYNSKNLDSNQSKSEDSDDDNEENVMLGPDIGLGNHNAIHGRKLDHENSLPTDMGNNSDTPRREENPISFKHFLNRDASTSNLTGGVRPKMYPFISPPSRIANPELTSGLPDFVQDHLVMEQCFSNLPLNHQLTLENLPDFTPSISNNDDRSTNREDIPFDLTCSQRIHINNTGSSIPPFDLPEGLPFDLPSGSNDLSGAVKSLPDFLSDDPIHSGRRIDLSHPPSEPSSPSLSVSEISFTQRLEMENERLRRELESSRRQLAEHIQRNQTLEAELQLAKRRDNDDTTHLEKVMEQVEDNLKRTTKRAISAESKVTELKQRVKLLSNELNAVRFNRADLNASANHSTDEQLARDLRTTVNNAEISLRQMLNGIDSLRIIASTLEDRNRMIEDQPPDFMDQESQDGSGPAL
uniref:Endosome-associated-trafficking regulator 1 n=2 Tax=Clastoptera arizonana TaxID=38151 RepID=A0A1B6CH86_9HEMI